MVFEDSCPIGRSELNIIEGSELKVSCSEEKRFVEKGALIYLCGFNLLIWIKKTLSTVSLMVILLQSEHTAQ